MRRQNLGGEAEEYTTSDILIRKREQFRGETRQQATKRTLLGSRRAQMQTHEAEVSHITLLALLLNMCA